MPFWQLVVPSSDEISEGLANFLWERGALGVVEEETGAAAPKVTAFFAEATSSTELLRAVEDYRASLRALGFSVGSDDAVISPLLDAAWASAWQQSFPARAIGQRLLVMPPWETAADPARVPVVIEPGRAFGTGHHGSTEGCLVLLERIIETRPVAPVLDVGTGSGILAVATAKLAGARVLAIDIDPDAIAAARANAERNGCSDLIDIRLEGPESLTGEAYPIVVANLLAHTHLTLRDLYRHLVAAGGALILGGILADEDATVIDAMGRAGFALRERLVVDGWSSLALDRSGVAERAS